MMCYVYLFLAGPTPAQEQLPEQNPPSIKIEVRQVLVPVVITDRGGHHVTGLKAGDFRVFEDGVEQRVVAFGTELGELRAPSPAGVNDPAGPVVAPASRPAAPPPIRRTYLVLVDTLFMSTESATRIRPALQSLFRQEESSDSTYALVALGRSLRIVRSVTRKPAEVLAAAESDVLVRAVRESGGGSLAGHENQVRAKLEDYCRQCECVGVQPPGSRPAFSQNFALCDSLLDNIENWAASAARERASASRIFLLRLADIIRQMGAQQVKRILILASDGLDLWPGRDLYTLIGAYTNRPTFPMRNPTERLSQELDAVARAATSGNVAIYAVDSRGMPSPSFGIFSAEHQGGRLSRADASLALSAMIPQMSAVENARQDTMARLTDVTGGVFFRGSNNIAKGLRQAFADEREYYVIAYAPANRAEDGKFRKIRVELKDKKPKIRAKAGYWAPSQGAKP